MLGSSISYLMIKTVIKIILKNEKYGEQAKLLFDDANAMLSEVIKNNELTADAVFGFIKLPQKMKM